ncbi:uncharacterized protein [Dasypus novemcinctus]|uniref:uncharacterized protein isoform X2 n=1 Tax=Dasypus novemcinctus TaxID=9361 RepID=UPI0039C9809F
MVPGTVPPALQPAVLCPRQHHLTALPQPSEGELCKLPPPAGQVPGSKLHRIPGDRFGQTCVLLLGYLQRRVWLDIDLQPSLPLQDTPALISPPLRSSPRCQQVAGSLMEVEYGHRRFRPSIHATGQATRDGPHHPAIRERPVPPLPGPLGHTTTQHTCLA